MRVDSSCALCRSGSTSKGVTRSSSARRAKQRRKLAPPRGRRHVTVLATCGLDPAIAERGAAAELTLEIAPARPTRISSAPGSSSRTPATRRSKRASTRGRSSDAAPLLRPRSPERVDVRQSCGRRRVGADHRLRQRRREPRGSLRRIREDLEALFADPRLGPFVAAGSASCARRSHAKAELGA